MLIEKANKALENVSLKNVMRFIDSYDNSTDEERKAFENATSIENLLYLSFQVMSAFDTPITGTLLTLQGYSPSAKIFVGAVYDKLQASEYATEGLPKTSSEFNNLSEEEIEALKTKYL